MFKDDATLLKYIHENYTEITDLRADQDHYNIPCDSCGVVMGFQVVAEHLHYKSGGIYEEYSENLSLPQVIVLRCPVCTSFKMWIIFKINFRRKNKGGITMIPKYYRLLSIPDEGESDIEQLPDNPPALRTAFKQALRAQNANAHIAAAAMYRRTLQVITREILGATPGNLATELKEIVGKEYDGVKITKNFQNVGYIVKEAGNQGAHPDEDPDLLDFTEQDAKDLGRILLELATELFIVPKAMRKAREDFKTRRKII